MKWGDERSEKVNFGDGKRSRLFIYNRPRLEPEVLRVYLKLYCKSL